MSNAIKQLDGMSDLSVKRWNENFESEHFGVEMPKLIPLLMLTAALILVICALAAAPQVLIDGSTSYEQARVMRLERSLNFTKEPMVSTWQITIWDGQQFDEYVQTHDLPTETASGIFWEMDDDYEEKVKGLLEHDEDEAGGLMTTQFMALKPEQTIAEALNYISRHAQEMDVIYYIYVVDNDSKLLGVTNLRELLSNEIFTPIGRIMTTRVITVRINDKAEDISDLFAKYGFRGIPVVDEDNHIEGVIRFKAFLEMLAPHLGR